jgi:hypothetical protein
MKKLSLGIAAAFFVLVCMANETSDPASMQPPAVEGADDHPLKTIQFLGLKAELPAGWVEQQTTSSMRVAQYLVPATNESGDAQFILFYFGRGQGGSVEDNIARWQSQFSSSDGALVMPTVEALEVNGMPVTIAEFTGNYARSIGIGQAGEALLEQTLIAAIVETPRGNLYAQLHGPAATVSAQRDAYLAFVNSIQSAGEPA